MRAPATDSALTGRVAPLWHTALLVALMLAVALAGLTLEPTAAPTRSRVVGTYLPLVIVNVALSAYVSRLALPRSILATLVGRRWDSWGRGLQDLALALAVAGAVLLIDPELARILGATNPATLHALLPASARERLAWVLVALVVGASEELVYRGYLQRQGAALMRSPLAGIALQSLLFGLAHGEQGASAMLRFGSYGLAFGALASVRRSLIPGMLAHVAIDMYAGLMP